MSFTLKRNTFGEDALRVSTEEAAHWIADTLSEDPDAQALKEAKDISEAFWDHIQTGVLLCKLAEKCSPATTWPPGAPAPVPDIKCPYNDKAKPGSFHARDNLMHFIESSKKIGVPEVSLFTPDDVVNRKNKKQVVNCILHLARLGVENGVTPPLMVQYELEIDAYEVKDASDDESGAVTPVVASPQKSTDLNESNVSLSSDVADAEEKEEDIEEEEFVAAQYGLTELQLQLITSVFKQRDTMNLNVVPKWELIEAVYVHPEIKAQAESDANFAKFFHNFHEVPDNEKNIPIDLGDFLLWFSSAKKSLNEIEAARDTLQAPKTRPRGLSQPTMEYKFLPYVPKTGDEIDQALAEEINKHNLDVRVRRVAITKKKQKHSHRVQGCYKFGDSDVKVYMRLVRGLLMVRSGSQWEGVVRYLQRIMADSHM